MKVKGYLLNPYGNKGKRKFTLKSLLVTSSLAGSISPQKLGIDPDIITKTNQTKHVFNYLGLPLYRETQL